MIVVIGYDIVDDTRRMAVFSYLKDFGLHSQKSLFECDLSPTEYVQIKAKLSSLIDHKTDSMRFYQFCKPCYEKADKSGHGVQLTTLSYIIL
jgi:CRISPR-associated protein Cas2